MLAFAPCQPLHHLRPPALAARKPSTPRRTRIRTRSSSMDPPVRRSPVAGFPYLPPPHRALMEDLLSSIEARLGPTLLPSVLPADVLYFESPQGTSQGTLDIRSGAKDSSVDFLLESWIHCKVPTGDLNITTFFAFLNTTTDAPHLVLEFIQSSPTSLILFMDLQPRKDLILHPEYIDEFYKNTDLDKFRQELEQLSQVSPYRSSSLYIRSGLSPTAVAVNVNCAKEGESCMDELIRGHISGAAKGILDVWLRECAGKLKDLEEPVKSYLLKRDSLIKTKTIEDYLAASLLRLFGPDIAGRIVGEIRKAFKIG